MARFIALLLVAGLPVATHAAVHQNQPAERGQNRDVSDGRRSGGPGERRIKWWIDEKTRAELGISDQQSAEIEQIFQSALPPLRQARKELGELETRLSQLIKDGTAPVSVITEQVERVEHARAEMNKRRTVMLYRIDRVLSAEQRAKLKAWHERREAAQRSGSGSSRH